MDSTTIDRIRFAHPSVRDAMLEDYLYVNNKLLGKGVRLRYSWVFRTPDEQNILYLKYPRVTNAKAWQSTHNYGLAFDIVILYDKNGDGIFEEASWDKARDGDLNGVADWAAVTGELERRGWSNGFMRNGQKWDFPHFQKSFGMKWRDMKAKIDNGQYTTEIIDGIEYRWIKI
jgi:peptidoglycan L-alanyl-D-glutamate endopeptidase CwlK